MGPCAGPGTRRTSRHAPSTPASCGCTTSRSTPAGRGSSWSFCRRSPNVNIATGLAAAGASFDDVVKLALYVVDWTADKLAVVSEGMALAAEKLGITARPPLTGIGVAALAEPDWLVEIEASAIAGFGGPEGNRGVA